MYVETVPNRNSPPAVLVRESYREDDKVKKRTLANISKLPSHVIDAVKQTLKSGVSLADASAFEIERSLPHGHVASVLGTIRRIGLDKLISSRRNRERDLVVALIASRLLAPDSKLATSRDLAGTASSTLGDELQLGEVTEYHLYSAMDWLWERRDAIEQRFARKHLTNGTLVLYDVSASYYTGSKCELAKLGYPRDGNRGIPQINYGVLCSGDGCPVAVEVFEGNIADPTTLTAQVEKLREKFNISRLVLVADRGTITSARIRDDLEGVEGLDWITALRAPAIRKLVEQGSIQLSLFDEVDLAEIASEDYPGERLIVCRNPLLAGERERKRDDLLAATEAELQKIALATQRKKRPLRGKDKIALRVGKVWNRWKVAKHFILEFGDESFSFRRDTAKIQAEAALDGLYVIRTSVEAERLGSEVAVARYKDLQKVEQAFRCLKSVDIQVRPIYHRDANRVRTHILLCMVAYYVQWHMQQQLAPILFREDDPDEARSLRSSIVAPARRSSSARAKDGKKVTPSGTPVSSFASLMRHLATLCRNTIKVGARGDTVEILTTPTALQQQAFELLKLTL